MRNPVATWISDSLVCIDELCDALELLALEMGQASDAAAQVRARALTPWSAEVVVVVRAVAAAEDRLDQAVRAARRLPPPPHAATAARLARVLAHLEAFVDSGLGDGLATAAWHAAMIEMTEFADAIATVLDRA